MKPIFGDLEQIEAIKRDQFLIKARERVNEVEAEQADGMCCPECGAEPEDRNRVSGTLYYCFNKWCEIFYRIREEII